MRAFLFPLPSLFLPHMLVRALLVIRLHLGIEKMHARFHRFFPSRAFERIAPVNANVLLPLRRRQKQPRPHRIALLPRRHGNHRSPRSRNASRPSRHAARIHPCPQVARASQNTQTSPNGDCRFKTVFGRSVSGSALARMPAERFHAYTSLNGRAERADS
jgi:hypothetical protein